jgi:hypothetical protein
MSQININQNNNIVDVTTLNNQVVVTNPDNPITINLTQPVTKVVEVITPGPQGPQGLPGTGSIVNTGSFVTTASFNAYTGSSTSQFAGTASFATTASFVTGTVQNAVNAQSGSNFVITSTLLLDGNLMDSSTVVSTIVGSNNLFTQATGSYTSAHGKYTVYKGANSRAGEFVTAWNGTTTSYYDNSTADIGNTTDVSFTSSIVTGQIQINAETLSSGWTVKMLVTYL